ncbi:hypothetical protein AYO44_09735 [Planctomycetaceae bacterium SCGC AG-212-F19]|nr:hypothetical protein AYO44_09735 [Planctomycetaceae bacterium SCGC AG-212-F19]
MFPPLFSVISAPTLIIVGLIGMIVFGNKLPSMARTLAQSFRAFQDTLHGREDDRDELVHTPAAPVALPRAPERVTAPGVKAVETNGLAVEPPLV